MNPIYENPDSLASAELNRVQNTNHDYGTVGGWNTERGALSRGNVSLSSEKELLLMGAATGPLVGVGIYLGLDGTDYEFRAGDPGGDYMHWDGSSLTIKGSITGSEIHIPSALSSAFHVDTSGNMWIGSSSFSTAKFRVDSSGDVVIGTANGNNRITIDAASNNTALMEVFVGGTKVGSFGVDNGSDTNRWQSMRIEPNVATAEASAYPYAGFDTFSGAPDYFTLTVRSSGSVLTSYNFTAQGGFGIAAPTGVVAVLQLSSDNTVTENTIALQASGFQVDTHWLPDTDDSYDLGSAAKSWRNLYLDNGATISGDATSRTLNKHWVPASNDTYQLGTTSNKWSDVKAVKINGATGVSGSFTTVDSKTVTVTNGIITAIV